MTPPTVNAYYDPQMNDINFPAGVLQPPLFDPRLDEAPNYGNTGATIGHELTHGFDDEGRQFDARGNLKDWWTAQDAKQFDERAACVVRGHQRRGRVRRLEIAQDRRRLVEDESVLLEGRHAAIGIEGAVGRLAVLPLCHVDEHELAGDLLLDQLDPDAARVGRERMVMELHRRVPCDRCAPSLGQPPSHGNRGNAIKMNHRDTEKHLRGCGNKRVQGKLRDGSRNARRRSASLYPNHPIFPCHDLTARSDGGYWRAARAENLCASAPLW